MPTLTDALIRKAARERGPDNTPLRLRDDKVPGFFTDISKTRISFFLQMDVMKHGHRRTIKKRLGIYGPEFATGDARKLAEIMRGKIKDDVVKPTAGGITLRRAWESYRELHLKRKKKSERTIAWYEDQIERALADWLDEPLATLGRDRVEIKHMHEHLAKERTGEVKVNGKTYKRTLGGQYAANQAMRAFRAVYRYASDDDDALPALKRFNFLFEERRRSTAIRDLADWWRQLHKMDEGKDVRRCFHALLLLSGSRPTALVEARWDDLDIPARKLHIRNPKGGASRAFDIPLSYRMLWWLAKARRAAIKETKGEGSPWLFPSSLSASGHIEEHKERRTVLSHWGNDLRQTYRTIADGRATQLQVKLLMNHALTDVTDGYADKALLWNELVAAQRRISAALSG